MACVCCPSYLTRLWREEAWGYPARPQVAILSLKFPASIRNPALTRMYRLLFAVGWTFWVIWSVVGTYVRAAAAAAAAARERERHPHSRRSTSTHDS